MKKQKLLLAFGAFVGSLFAFLLVSNGSVFAATKTWDGEGSDNNFSTDANWSGDSAPTNGDDLVFDNTGLAYDDTQLTNDITSASFAGITFQGNGSNSFYVTGNSFTLTGTFVDTTSGDGVYHSIDASITLSGDKTINVPSGHLLSLTGDIDGSGDIAWTGAGTLMLGGDNSAYTGSINLSAGLLRAVSANAVATSGGTTVGDGAEIYFAACTDTVFAGNLTLSGASKTPSGQSPTAKLYTAIACSGGGGAFDETYGLASREATATLSGAITLGSDVTFGSYATTTKLTGPLSGGYKMNVFEGGLFSLVVQSSANSSSMTNGTYESGQLTTSLSNDSSSTTMAILGKTIVTLTGKRGDTTVFKGATLKGTGTVGSLTISNGAFVAPGLSPGTLNSGSILFEEGGTYKFEIGKSAADQIKVTGTVTLGNGTLDVQHYESYIPPVNKQYIIIDNDGSDAVTGTFKDLANGATFSRNGYTYQISYNGGDGNDVVLTIKNVPASPDTGIAMLTQNPLAVLATTTSAAATIYLIAKRYHSQALRR